MLLPLPLGDFWGGRRFVRLDLLKNFAEQAVDERFFRESDEQVMIYGRGGRYLTVWRTFGDFWEISGTFGDFWGRVWRLESENETKNEKKMKKWNEKWKWISARCKSNNKFCFKNFQYLKFSSKYFPDFKEPTIAFKSKAKAPPYLSTFQLLSFWFITAFVR